MIGSWQSTIGSCWPSASFTLARPFKVCQQSFVTFQSLTFFFQKIKSTWNNNPSKKNQLISIIVDWLKLGRTHIVNSIGGQNRIRNFGRWNKRRRGNVGRGEGRDVRSRLSWLADVLNYDGAAFGFLLFSIEYLGCFLRWRQRSDTASSSSSWLLVSVDVVNNWRLCVPGMGFCFLFVFVFFRRVIFRRWNKNGVHAHTRKHHKTKQEIK